jgi:hypothetical protein
MAAGSYEDAITMILSDPKLVFYTVEIFAQNDDRLAATKVMASRTQYIGFGYQKDWEFTGTDLIKLGRDSPNS